MGAGLKRAVRTDERVQGVSRLRELALSGVRVGADLAVPSFWEGEMRAQGCFLPDLDWVRALGEHASYLIPACLLLGCKALAVETCLCFLLLLLLLIATCNSKSCRRPKYLKIQIEACVLTCGRSPQCVLLCNKATLFHFRAGYVLVLACAVWGHQQVLFFPFLSKTCKANGSNLILQMRDQGTESLSN